MAGTVDLWLAHDPQLREPQLLRSFAELLPSDETARVSAMHFPADRHQQLVTRAMLRLVLSRQIPDVAPADWRFERNEQGRPRIAGDFPATARELNFNLAHTPGLVVLAVGRVPKLGVDVEHTGKPAPLGVARRHFSAQEVAALDALPAPEQPLRFRRLWTLKEAYLKAIGTGVVGGLGSMTFHLDDGALRFERPTDPEAHRWEFRELEPSPGYRVALAMLLAPGEATPQVKLRLFTGSGEEQGAQA